MALQLCTCLREASTNTVGCASRERLHCQDCPYQFGACPEFTGASDYAEDAAAFELPVQPGDVIVAGTDGLWDNVPEDDLLPLLPEAEEGALQARIV